MDDNEEPTTPTVARRGFFPLVIGDDVRIQEAGTMAIVSKGDVSLTQGGVQMMLVGGDVSIRQGGCQTILSTGEVSIRQGGAVFAAAPAVRVNDGWVGVALGWKVDLSDARVLFGPVQALAFGAAAGVAAGVAMAFAGKMLARCGWQGRLGL